MPRVSVIIPTFNEAAYICDCLESVFSQECGFPYEVIIADGPSTDGTEEAVLRFPVRLVHVSRRGIGIAWKMAVLTSEADVLAFTEADCVVPRTWLFQMLSILEEDPRCIGVVGPVLFRGADPLASVLTRVGCMAVDQLHKAWKGTVAFRGKNFAIRRWALESCGGFDDKVEAYGDLELSLRAMHCGDIRYVPSLVVETSPRQFACLHDRLAFLKRFFTAVYLVELAHRPRDIRIEGLLPEGARTTAAKRGRRGR